MIKQTKEQWVIERLNTVGEITRNEALKHSITRLSGIIFVLKEAGYKFNSYRKKNRTGYDYVYECTNLK